MTINDDHDQPAGAEQSASVSTPSGGRRLALSALFFSFATGLSRVAGLIREVIAARYFGVSPAMSAFTIAFQVPNLVRSLFADAALQAAFVPVFADLLDKGDRREAFRVASTLFYLILLVLGAVTALFVIAAPWIIPLFAPGFDAATTDLTVNLSRLLFPIVLMLGLTGLFAGMLNSLDHFSVPAIAPLFWNIAIIAAIVGLVPVLPAENQIYAYAIGVLAGTLIQTLMPLPVLRRRAAGERLGRSFEWRDKNVRRVLVLMLPVTIGLGLINFNLSINSFFGTLVDDRGPAAIDKAFRVYMLPQGMFSVAIATILFPTLSRYAARKDFDGLRTTMANGIRQVCLLLIPAAAATAVLAEPMTRLLYERGAFGPSDTDLVASALFWFAFSLPFSGVNLLLTRTFFALQTPWLPTALAGLNLLINAVLALALYKPFGIAGIVVATVVSTAVMAVAQAAYLRKPLGGVEAGETISAVARMSVAAGLLLVTSYLTWLGLDGLLGRSLLAQTTSLGTALVSGAVVYGTAVMALRVDEAHQIAGLIKGRLRRAI